MVTATLFKSHIAYVARDGKECSAEEVEARFLREVQMAMSSYSVYVVRKKKLECYLVL
jgi:hypothetical protein